MKFPKPPAQNLNSEESPDQEGFQRKVKVLKAGHGIATGLAAGNFEKAFARTVAAGIKLAADNVFKDPLSSPLVLSKALKDLGVASLVWAPETLFSAIDRKHNGWSHEKALAALDKFQETGVIQTDVPSLVRQKIYAIRIIATSDTAHNEWHVFEKVGCAFNDRVARFDVVEKLSPGECARTIACIEHIRPDPDHYSKEVQIYIAASAHEDGLLSLKPSKYLGMADKWLQNMNFESTGAKLTSVFEGKIAERYNALKPVISTLAKAPESLEDIQALKLLAIDSMGDSV